VLLRLWLRTEREKQQALTGAVRLTIRLFVIDINATYHVREPDVYKMFMLRRTLYQTPHGPQVEISTSKRYQGGFRMMYYGKQMSGISDYTYEGPDRDCLKIQEYVVNNQIVPVKILAIRSITNPLIRKPTAYDDYQVQVERNDGLYTVVVGYREEDDEIYKVLPEQELGQTNFEYAKVVALYLAICPADG